jgi:hypothetical protein
VLDLEQAAADIESPEHALLPEGEAITQRFESALIEQFAPLKVTHCDGDMIDHAVPSLSFQRPIIVEIAAAEKQTTVMAKGECQISSPCPNRADSPTPAATCPADGKSPANH